MRLRQRKFSAKVAVQAGDTPIIIGLGMLSLECTISEALELGHALADAVEQVQRGGDCE
jgi:hypothetical protein